MAKNGKGFLGVALLAVTALLAIVAFFHTPYDPNQMDISRRLLTPDARHWLGTDQFGRDVLSRTMVASQNAYKVGIGSVLFGMSAGVAVGSLAGWVQGWLGELAMRVVDGLYAFPHFLLALLIVSVLGSGERNVLLAIGVFNIPVFARLTFGSVLEKKQAGYVKAARAYGAPGLHILRRHIVPAVWPRLLVQATSSFGLAILTEASLSFLGLGVRLPNASWGTMLEEARSFLTLAPWYPFIPGLAILVTVLGANLLGDSLQRGG